MDPLAKPRRLRCGPSTADASNLLSFPSQASTKGTLGAHKQSNLARYGTYGLVILWYVIFTLGTLFQFDFGGAGMREQAIRLLATSVAFIVMLALLRSFFETAPN